MSQETRIKELHEKIGHLMVEREIGTRLRSISRDQRKSVVEMNHPRLAVVRQCHLLGLCRRSTFYYKASGETPKNLALIGLTPDEVYCDRPGPPVVPDRTTEAA